jgi:hypothetical protein
MSAPLVWVIRAVSRPENDAAPEVFYGSERLPPYRRGPAMSGGMFVSDPVAAHPCALRIAAEPGLASPGNRQCIKERLNRVF